LPACVSRKSRQRTVTNGVEGALDVTDTTMTLLALLVAGNLVLAGAFSLVAVATD